MFESKQSGLSGYKLIDNGNGIWKMLTPSGQFTGSLKDVCRFAVHRHGFSMKEIEVGVLEMEKHFHNAAEYGMFKSFMWSYDLEEKDANTIIH